MYSVVSYQIHTRQKRTKQEAFNMKTYYYFLIAILAFSSCSKSTSNFKKGDNIKGKVIGIVDGDTYDILVKGKKPLRIRMEGIDAPEKGMPYYKTSKKYLSELCFGKDIKVLVTGFDRSERILGLTYLHNGEELSHLMIKNGMAWHFKKYNSYKDLSDLEIEARIARIGIWTDLNPMPPWVNKSLHSKGISTKDSFNIKPESE